MRTIAMLLTALCATGAAAQVEFKGFRLGSPKQELIAKFPRTTCERPGPRFEASMGQETCTDDYGTCSRLGRTDCLSGPDYGTYAGVNAWGHRFAVIDGNVENFSLTVYPRDYEKVRDALKEAHGNGIELSRNLQTRGGAVLPSRTWEVKKPDGTITLFEHGTRLDQGHVYGSTTAFEAWQKTRKPADAAKGAKDI